MSSRETHFRRDSADAKNKKNTAVDELPHEGGNGDTLLSDGFSETVGDKKSHAVREASAACRA